MKETAREKELKKIMGEKLKKIRLDNGITSIGMVTRELGFSKSALPKIESGVNFPSSRTLNLLIGSKMGISGRYKTTPTEYKELRELQNEMKTIRKLRKER